MRKPLPGGLLRTILLGALGFFIGMAILGVVVSAADAAEPNRNKCDAAHETLWLATVIERQARQTEDIALRERMLKGAQWWRREAERIFLVNNCEA